MAELHAYAERRMRAAIGRLPNGVYQARDVVEGDGTDGRDVEIQATVTVRGDRIEVDFAGTAAQVAGNVNCPLR